MRVHTGCADEAGCSNRAVGLSGTIPNAGPVSNLSQALVQIDAEDGTLTVLISDGGGAIDLADDRSIRVNPRPDWLSPGLQSQ